MSHGWRIPKKGDDKGWLELKQIIALQLPKRAAYLVPQGTKLLAEFQKQIDWTEKHRSPEKREKLLKPLKGRKRSMLRKYFAEGEVPSASQ